MTDQSHDSDLRGSTPIYTAKEILQALDRKVGEMDLKMDGFIVALQIMVSQNLNTRVVQLENDSKKIEGMGLMLKALFGGNVIVLIIAIISIIGQFTGAGNP